MMKNPTKSEDEEKGNIIVDFPQTCPDHVDPPKPPAQESPRSGRRSESHMGEREVANWGMEFSPKIYRPHSQRTQQPSTVHYSVTAEAWSRRTVLFNSPRPFIPVYRSELTHATAVPG